LPPVRVGNGPGIHWRERRSGRSADGIEQLDGRLFRTGRGCGEFFDLQRLGTFARKRTPANVWGRRLAHEFRYGRRPAASYGEIAKSKNRAGLNVSVAVRRAANGSNPVSVSWPFANRVIGSGRPSANRLTAAGLPRKEGLGANSITKTRAVGLAGKNGGRGP